MRGLRRQRGRWGAWATLLLCLATAKSAQADVQTWLGFQAGVPFSEGWFGLPHEFRWSTELRLGGSDGGVNYLLLRGGPTWNLASWARLNLNAVAVTEKTDPTIYRQQLRVEVEPSFRWKLGSFEFNDRNRVERRWIINDSDWRYRNQLRVSYARPKAVWIPFISEEVFFDLSEGRYSENRAIVGVGWVSPRLLRMELGYLWRMRLNSADEWEPTHVVSFSFTFSPDVETLVHYGGW